MTPDPYPDLLGTELPDPVSGADDGAPDEPVQLSEADSRLLDALSRPAPPVVTAVEDELRTARDDSVAPFRPAGGHASLAPVFQEPPG